MKIKLVTELKIIASHSLAGFETPLPHLWKFKLTMAGDPVEGRIIDLPSLIEATQKMLKPYENTYLNDRRDLPRPAHEFPTCETLGAAFFEKIETEVLPPFRVANPTVRLHSLEVALCDLDGTAMGSAIIEP